MARYEITLQDETTIEADDARYACGGSFIEFIPRRPNTQDRVPELCSINADQVRLIHRKPIGFKGGWRFTGERDAFFDATEGSI
jgi:hypothetical protein